MEAFGVRTAGLFAKMVWALVHIQFLVLMSSRIGTLFRWSWKLLTRQRLARLIIEPEDLCRTPSRRPSITVSEPTRKPRGRVKRERTGTVQ